MKNKHGHEIVVNADKSDWGKRWGIAPERSKKCWCYDCTMKWLDKHPVTEKRKGKKP